MSTSGNSIEGEQMTSDEERILWEAHAAICDALRLCGREALVDYLAESTREKLFSGYVLREHYECLQRKYDILKVSHIIQNDAVQNHYPCC